MNAPDGQVEAEQVSGQRRRGRPKAAPDVVQRTEIAEAAWAILLERGYGGTSMNDVAARARVSLRTIYRFYPTKPQLFAGVVALQRRSLLALPGDYDHLPLVEALEQIFQVDLPAEAEHQREALMSIILVEGRQFPELSSALEDQGPRQSSHLLAEWLERQRSLGRMAFEDAGLVANMLMDVVFGAVALRRIDQPAMSDGRDRSAYLRRCFLTIVEGLRPRD